MVFLIVVDWKDGLLIVSFNTKGQSNLEMTLLSFFHFFLQVYHNLLLAGCAVTGK